MPVRYLRSLYDWVMHWAETPYGVPALFLLAFTESAFFPVPPDLLLIALAAGLPRKALWYALVCLAGSLTGAYLGYAIGYFGWETVGRPLVDFYNGHEVMAWIRQQYTTYGFWGVFVAALTPIPYKIFTIASGLFQFDLTTFTVASILGRGLRFLAVGMLIYRFGASIKDLIDRRFNLMVIIFTVLLIGGFLLLKLFL
ncbi:MAG: DedA family protein [Candidatus Marinimicrobia bacterium]|nr:DedA family protein [Candidatus Neomarinimicrobiota bacterium]